MTSTDDIDHELREAARLIKKASDHPETPEDAQYNLGRAFSKVHRVHQSLDEDRSVDTDNGRGGGA